MPIYTVQTRPHHGCASCPLIYDIADAKSGAVVRSQLSNPSDDDARTAVLAHRAAVEGGGVVKHTRNTRPAGGAAGGRRGKRVSIRL